MQVAHLVPQIALAVGAALTLVVALLVPQERQGWGAPTAVAALVVSALTQLDLLRATPQLAAEGTWALDGTTAYAHVTIVAATVGAVLLTPDWLRRDRRHGEYYTLLLLAALGASVLAGAADLAELIVGVVLSSVTGYVLASYHRRSATSAEAGIKFFLVGGLTNTALLVGAVLLYGLVATTRYAAVTPQLATADPTVLVAATVLLVVGLAFELGAVPGHPWLPDVADGAPAPSAAFLTTVPKLGALVALARLLSLLPEPTVGWRPLIAVVAAATMTLGNLAALWQDDLRRLLGWSSVSQAGYGLLAIVALGRSDLALPALLLFLVAYAAANLAAFGVVTQLRGRSALTDYAGLGRARPALATALTVALLSLVGIPPTAGFAAKLVLFGSAIDAGYTWLAVLAVANTVVSLFYYLRVIAPAYLGARPERPVAVLGRSAAWATSVTTAAVVAVGVAAGPLLSAFDGARLLP